RTGTVSVLNAAPSPAIGGLPSGGVPEGTAVSLTASATDPSGPDTAAGFTFAWTVKRGGATYATGSGPAFSFTPNDDGSYAVTLTATDKDGGTGTATATVTVTNVAPTASVAGASVGVRGQDLGFTVSATDPSAADSAAAFTYAVDWGD